MKVLMAATSYPRFADDSAAVFLRYLARSIGRCGYDVHVLAPNDPLADDSVSDERITIHRFEYFLGKGRRLAYGSGVLPNLRACRWLYLQIPLFLVAFAISLFSLTRRVQPDVIHAHWVLPTGLVAVLVGKMLGVPVVTSVHGGDAFLLRSPISGWLKKFTLNSSAAWTSNTNSTASAAIGASCVRAPSVIPMGIDVQLFASGNRTAHRRLLEDDAQIILFVGRLVGKKGCDVLIKAFKRVVVSRPHKAMLWIVGDGDERRDLEALVIKLGLSSAVRFFGQQSNENLPDIYAGADLFVLPSTTEGQGVVLLEAMAAGVPTIACQVGGVKEVIDDAVTGWLVKPTDSGLLADKIGECLDSIHLRAAVAERAKCQVISYDWPVVARRFIELYDSVPR